MIHWQYLQDCLSRFQRVGGTWIKASSRRKGIYKSNGMQLLGSKRGATCESDAHHHHSDDPEEDDVVSCLQQWSWVEFFEVCCLLRPPHRRKGEQARRKPCIQYIHILQVILWHAKLHFEEHECLWHARSHLKSKRLERAEELLQVVLVFDCWVKRGNRSCKHK